MADDDPVVSIAPGVMGRSWRRNRRLPQMLFKLAKRHGLGVIIALHIGAVHMTQDLQLLLCLNALRHHSQIQPFGKTDDKAENILAAVSGRLILNKVHIQLYYIQRKLGEHIQRRVAGAEIVHFNDKAQLSELSHHGNELIGIFRVGGLRNLQMQIRRLQPVFMEHVQQQLRQI